MTKKSMRLCMAGFAPLMLLGAGCAQMDQTAQKPNLETSSFTLSVDPKYNIVTVQQGIPYGVSGNEAPSGTIFKQNGKTLVVDDSFYIRWNFYPTAADATKDFNQYCAKSTPVGLELGGRAVQYCPLGLYNAESYGGPAYLATDVNPPTLIYIDADSTGSKVAVPDAQAVLNTIVWK